MLLHNDVGGHVFAAAAVRERFGNELGGSIRTAVDDLVANFQSPSAQGPQAYATQMRVDHPGLDETTLLAVEEFHAAVLIPDQGVIPPAP